MYDPYGYYGQNAGSTVSGAVASSVATGQHAKEAAFMGLDWKSIIVAVIVGSMTAVLTQLSVEHVQDRRKKLKKTPTESAALILTED